MAELEKVGLVAVVGVGALEPKTGSRWDGYPRAHGDGDPGSVLCRSVSSTRVRVRGTNPGVLSFVSDI